MDALEERLREFSKTRLADGGRTRGRIMQDEKMAGWMVMQERRRRGKEMIDQ